MANLGRVRTAPIDLGAFAMSITENVGEEADMKRWFPYSQRNSRRCPRWSELWRLRSALHEFLLASSGFMHCQKDVERSVRTSFAELSKGAADDDEVEAAAYRIRAMMMHARNIKSGLWKIPKRYMQLDGIIAHARLDSPPQKQKRDSDEPQLCSSDE